MVELVTKPRFTKEDEEKFNRLYEHALLNGEKPLAPVPPMEVKVP